ncbi:hypothetical protein C1N61_29440 (plasmid) [Priestia aryabhattai]
MIREIPTLKSSTNLLIFKIATGEQKVLEYPLREEIKIYLEDNVSLYNPKPSHPKDVLKEQQAVIDKTVQKAVEAGYAEKYSKEELDDLLLKAIVISLGEPRRRAYHFFKNITKKMYEKKATSIAIGKV